MIRKLAAVSGTCFLLFVFWILYLANTGGHSIFFEMLRVLPYGDKVGHVCLFGLATLVANYVLKLKLVRIGRLRLYLGSIAVTLFVMFEESSQALIVLRTFDQADIGANLFGIMLFSFVSRCLGKRMVAAHP